MRPLLLLDVDGPLNPYAASRRWLDGSDYRKRDITVTDGRTFPVWLDKSHGPLLLDLAETAGLELVWCTTWEHMANTEIGPHSAAAPHPHARPRSDPRPPRLAETAGLELVWCTTWEHMANTETGPRIGLPKLPVIAFPRKFSGTMIDRWKFGPVLEYAEDRPLAWFDDDFELEHEDCAWFREQRGDRPTLLQLVDPHHGLRQRDLDAVKAWAADLPVGSSSVQGEEQT